MNGTSNTLNFKSRVEGNKGFKLKPFPFVNENEGRLLLATTSKGNVGGWGSMPKIWLNF